jgi:hypothetical protein
MTIMTDRAFAATRKGLFELRRDGDAWRIALVHSVPLPEQEQRVG